MQVYTLCRIFEKNRILLKISQLLGKCICYKEPEEELSSIEKLRILKVNDVYPEEEDKDLNVAKLVNRKNQQRQVTHES